MNTQSERANRNQISPRKTEWLVGAYILFVFSALIFTLWIKGILNLTAIRTFSTLFVSILIQAFPFMLIGVLVSSAMHFFVPDSLIVKVFPTRHGLGFLTALFAGLFFPVCECAIVPVMTRLVKKGVALPIAISFMLAAPIINPIVIVSTLYAFPGQSSVMLLRVSLGLLIALMVGLALFALGIGKKQSLLGMGEAHENAAHLHAHDGYSPACTHAHDDGSVCACCANPIPADMSFFRKVSAMLLHAGDEFFDVGKYIVIGAFISALIQAVIPRESFVSLGAQSGLSLLVMMLMAFLLSACSTSDAFIARSYLGRLTLGPILGFLVYGPMMDIKNMLILLGSFKKSFVILLITIITVLNFVTLYFVMKLLM